MGQFMWFITEEEKQLQEVCREFAKNELTPHAEHYDQKEQFNQKAFKAMGKLGLLGITADPDYGGAGLGAVAATLVMEEFGRACASSTLSYLAHSILCVNNISSHASDQQKAKFLPKLISGEWVGCMGMSEPDYGSDALGMQTRAVLDNNQYLVNGSKMWITNGPYAEICYLYARTGEGRKDISTFIVEKQQSPFDASKEIHKLGMRASPTGELLFTDTPVPLANRVGVENSSIQQMMQNLDLERITISGISLGIAQSCLDQCIRYAGERKQFGKSLGSFQMIQKMLAEMKAETEMMRSFLYTSAKRYDQGEQNSTLAAEVKLNLPKMATKIALDAVQLHGGYGYSREFPLERYLRDAKLMEIGAGTNEVMIMIIAKNLLKG